MIGANPDPWYHGHFVPQCRVFIPLKALNFVTLCPLSSLRVILPSQLLLLVNSFSWPWDSSFLHLEFGPPSSMTPTVSLDPAGGAHSSVPFQTEAFYPVTLRNPSFLKASGDFLWWKGSLKRNGKNSGDCNWRRRKGNGRGGVTEWMRVFWGTKFMEACVLSVPKGNCDSWICSSDPVPFHE